MAVLAALGAALLAAAADAEVGAWLLRFTGAPSRYIGSPGHRAALAAVEEGFRSIGLRGVRRERIKVVAPVEEAVWLEGPGVGRRTLHMVWPNHVQLSATPRNGLEGPLVDGGHGEAGALNGKPVEGAIVLVRLPCTEGRQGWITPFTLGAAAVIFLPPKGGALTRPEAEELFMAVPADLPRFWAPEAAALVDAARSNPKVKLVARAAWREVATDNILGFLPGSDERFPSANKKSTAKWKEKTVVLQAYTDSMSVVPALAPGAEEACGLAALMELAGHFAANPPKSSLVFLATSGHGHALSGSHDFFARHTRQDSYFSKSITGDEKIDVTLFVGLDLSSGDPRVASFSQSTFYNAWENDMLAQNAMAGMARTLDAYATRLYGKGSEGRYLNGVSPPTRTWKDLLGFRAAFDGEAAVLMGTRALTFASPFDARLREDTPLDTPDAVNQASLARQTATIRDLLALALSDAGFFEESKLELPDMGRAFAGEVHEFERTIIGLPQKPVAGALMTCWAGAVHGGATITKTLGPVRSLQTWLTEKDNALTMSVTETGSFRVPVVKIKEWWAWVCFSLRGFLFNEDGEMTLASDTASITAVQFAPDPCFQEREGRTLHVLFRCHPFSILEPVDARYLRFLDSVTMMDGFNQPFMNANQDVVASQSMAQDQFTPAVVLFTPQMEGQEVRVKALMSTGPFGLKGIFTGADESLLDLGDKEIPELASAGAGYPVKGKVLRRAPFEGAKDMWILDERRGRTLRSHNVRSYRIEELHEKARTSLQEARQAWADGKYDTFMARSREAWGLEARAYPEFRAVANDLVQTVVFYCILLLPFAYCMERLLFAFADLRKQIGATSVLFILGFLALREVHPAFRISSNPLIIFLGFIVLTLGLVVLSIITMKFQRELRRLKGERGDYEAVDIGRVSATVAALTLGLSNLRKRPVRTGLTITTVVMLTFTVLSMVSMSSTIQFFRLPRGANPPYTGSLIRDVQWQVLQPPVEQYVRSALSGCAHIIPRSWVTARSSSEAMQLEIAGPGGSGMVSAMVGLVPEDALVIRPKANLSLSGRWFAAGDRNVCILPDKVAALAGAGVGDTVRVRGTVLTVIGTVSGKKLFEYRDLDGEAITPAKFAVRRGRYDWEQSQDMNPTQSVAENFQAADHMAGDAVVLIPHGLALEMEGRLRAIVVLPKAGTGTDEIVKKVKEFLVRAAVMALMSDGKTVQLLTSIGAVSVKGLLSLLIPVTLACLIVLNTMMGSVHERVREISIFSSVGLAPTHIGALFVAESFVVAIVGVVLGYLIAQFVSTLLLNAGALTGLSLNYSSSAAVGACIIVMGAVMISTIYPARKASELAVPDVTRRWKLPKPEGDSLVFDFPFTVGSTDLLGMFMYLTDLFKAFRDSSIGSFSTDRVTLSKTAHGVAIDMSCWLAPYDLGISQRVRLEAIPMEVKGLYRIQVTLERRSGEAGSWYRQNRRFLTTLRKRFLIWRMFGLEIKGRYEERGKAHLAGGTGG